MLAAFYGNDTPFTVTSAGLPGVQRNLTSFAAAVRQMEDARIYAGFHFRFSCTDAAILGAKVAHYVTGTLMQPAPKSGANPQHPDGRTDVRKTRSGV